MFSGQLTWSAPLLQGLQESLALSPGHVLLLQGHDSVQGDSTVVDEVYQLIHLQRWEKLSHELIGSAKSELVQVGVNVYHRLEGLQQHPLVACKPSNVGQLYESICAAEQTTSIHLERL